VIRLIATDVDGTLLDHHNRLPPARRDAVRRVQAAGIPVVLATGKVWPSIRPLWEELELPGPHVSCNGAAVVSADGTIHQLVPLDDEVADDVATELHRRHIPHAIYLEDGTLVTNELVPALDVLPALGEPPAVEGSRDGRRVLKVLSVLDEQDEGDLRSLHADAARVQRTSFRFLEWNHPAADKASGLRVAADVLGIDLADVVAIGDAENDLPMLRAAGMGIAVADASEAARDAADVHLQSDLAAYLDEVAAAGISA
jgi:Cof subfamily protein (haloacid dehalogenase superfamily)